VSQLQTVNNKAEAIERVVIGGDLSKLNAEERVNYYKLVCESVGLNPLTKPFEYIMLNGKLTLYARKDATDQLRQNHQVSITIQSRETTEGCYVVTARATLPNGRTDESLGAVPIENLKGENRANALMKCETKAKRRVTLSICGLGMLDELEIETIPSAKPEPAIVAEPKTFTRPSKAWVDPGPYPEAAVRDSGGTKAPSFSGKGTPEAPNGSEHTAPTPPERDPIPALAQALVDNVITPSAENVNRPGINDPDALIDMPMRKRFHRAFKDAIPKSAAKSTHDAKETILQEWLKHEGFFDANGRGTTERIPMVLFEELKDKAEKFAGTLR